MPLELFPALLAGPQSLPADKRHLLNTDLKCMIYKGADMAKGRIGNNNGCQSGIEVKEILPSRDIGLNNAMNVVLS